MMIIHSIVVIKTDKNSVKNAERNTGTKEKYDDSDWNGNGSSSKDINLCATEFEIFRENTKS